MYSLSCGLIAGVMSAIVIAASVGVYVKECVILKSVCERDANRASTGYVGSFDVVASSIVSGESACTSAGGGWCSHATAGTP